jgi:hypothetical protein
MDYFQHVFTGIRFEHWVWLFHVSDIREICVRLARAYLICYHGEYLYFYFFNLTVTFQSNFTVTVAHDVTELNNKSYSFNLVAIELP